MHLQPCPYDDALRSPNSPNSPSTHISIFYCVQVVVTIFCTLSCFVSATGVDSWRSSSAQIVIAVKIDCFGVNVYVWLCVVLSVQNA